MKLYRIRFFLIVGLFVLMSCLIGWQQRIINGLRAQLTTLRRESDKTKQLQEENATLSDELKSVQERVDAERRELLRLRGQISGMRDKDKEIAQLKAERERAQQELQAAAPPAVQPVPEETPERKRTIARLHFSKQIGLALIMAAADNQEQLPANLEAVEGKYLQRTPEMDEQNLQIGQFQMLYKGKINEAQEPGRTVLAREREPVQRTDGTWQQVYVFVDGHAEVLSAPTREQLVQREKEQFILPAQP